MGTARLLFGTAILKKYHKEKGITIRPVAGDIRFCNEGRIPTI